MDDRAAHDWAIALAACLELGVFCLYRLDAIGTTATIAWGFAVGAVLVTALLLRPPRPDDEAEGSNEPL